jgi:predicted glutamine amidotransferase
VCELFCLSSRLPTRATFSLEKFASHGGVGGPIDGWGIAFHEGRDVRLYKEPEPAADSSWLQFIRQRQLASPLVLSHIRRATRGPISLANTQPFVRELGGRMHVFAHNGRLEGIDDQGTGPRRFSPVGETDSELAFCILLENLAPLWSGGKVPSLDERQALIARFAGGMRALGPANFLYTDGDALFAHGHRRIQQDGTIAPPGLWHLSRECSLDTDALAQAGVMIEADPGPQQIALFASVPLTSESWRPLDEGEVLAVRAGRVLASMAPVQRSSIAEPLRFGHQG